MAHLLPSGFCSLALFYFRPHHTACGILDPQPETKPRAMAVKALSPNLWTTREVPFTVFTSKVFLRRLGEQDSGVGGRGVHLSPQIHQEYTFRHRSACRTPAESRQEYLTSGKAHIEPPQTQ